MELSELTTKQLLDELHNRYDEYIFMGILQQNQSEVDNKEHSFQTSFKAPTIAEALGMAEFFKSSLLNSQMQTANVTTTASRVGEDA